MNPEVPKDDDDMLAAEVALGMISDDAIAAVRQRLADDLDFARAVTEWETYFASIAEEDLDDVTPDAALKSAVQARLFPNVEPKTWWRRLGLWQAVSGFSLAALIALMIFGFQPAPAPGPLYSAEIVATDGDFRVLVLVDKTTDEVILTRTEGSAPDGRILQVWAHGENAPAISVGLWPEGETVRLPMPPVIAGVEGILTVGVSEEPPGGSPTGSPSGRVFGTVDIPGVTGA